MRALTMAFLFAAVHWPGCAEGRIITAAAGGPVTAVPLVSGGGALHWKDGNLTLRLSRSIRTEDGNGGVDARETVESVHAALADAARAWTTSTLARISIAVEATDEQAANPARNIVTFTDPAPFDKGICDKYLDIACTLVNFVAETGEIQGFATAFNPYQRYSSIGLPNTLDIGAVMVHEVGHAFGLDHSALVNTAMNPIIGLVTSLPTPVFVLRQVSADDLLSLAEVYPAADAASRLGKVSGLARLDGAPLAGAHVMAVGDDGIPVRSTLTDAAGKYAMTLERGNYILVLEPLDGPIDLKSFAQWAGKVPVKFPTVFWCGAGGDPLQPDPVAIEPGGSVFADFNVAMGEVLNLQRIGVLGEGDTSYVFEIDLPRGGEYSLSAIIDPSPITGTPVLRLSAPRIQATSGTERGPDPDLAEQSILIPPDAPLGSFNLYYHNGVSGAVLAGAVRVTVRPTVASVRATEDGLGIIITGTDLAELEKQSEGATQLGGVSVRFGDRYAPLLAVSPTEIRALVPAGVGPGQVPVTVVAGANASSFPVDFELIAR